MFFLFIKFNLSSCLFSLALSLFASFLAHFLSNTHMHSITHTNMHRIYFGDHLCATTNPFKYLYGLYNFVRGMQEKRQRTPNVSISKPLISRNSSRTEVKHIWLKIYCVHTIFHIVKFYLHFPVHVCVCMCK